MYDQFHDPTFKILVSALRDRPELKVFVKTASIDFEEAERLPNSAFAWQERRMYPFHTPEHAAVSYVYATDKTSSVPEDTLHLLKTAIEMYGLSIPTEKTAEASEELLEDYILPNLKRWKVTNEVTFKLAEANLHGEGHVLPLEDRIHAAQRLFKKAAALGINVDIETTKLAGMSASSNTTLQDNLYIRSEAARKRGMLQAADAYEKLAEHLRTSRREPITYDRNENVKVASLLHEIDKKATIVDLYGKIEDPVRAVFNTDKLAEETVDVGGRQVPINKLANVPLSAYADAFGDDIVSEITSNGRLDSEKLAVIIPTMPRDLLRIFMRHIR